MRKIPFYRPCIDTGAALTLLQEALENHWLTTGPLQKKFENELGLFLRTNSLVLLNSATAALQLSLRLAGIGQGDEVILPAITFIATMETVVLAGARPVLADIDIRSFNLSAKKLTGLLTKNTKAVLFVPMGGNASGFEEVMLFCQEKGLTLILDSAHALETTYKGKPLHTYAQYTCLSFYATKNLTSAEGGALILPSGQLDHAKALSLHGMSREAWARYQGGGWRYDIVDFGYKYNLTDIHSALALVQLPFLDNQLIRRREITAIYKRRLAATGKILFQENIAPFTESDTASHLMLCVLKPNSVIDRDSFLEKMTQVQIGLSVHFIPLYLFTAVKKTYSFSEDDFPVSRQYFSGAFSLPLYPSLSDDEVEYICDKIEEIIHGGG